MKKELLKDLIKSVRKCKQFPVWIDIWNLSLSDLDYLYEHGISSLKYKDCTILTLEK